METCPFCGDEMRRGWIHVRGVLRSPSLTTATFEVGDGSREGSEILKLNWLGRGKRRASCCVGCEAVVIDPKDPKSQDGVDEDAGERR